MAALYGLPASAGGASSKRHAFSAATTQPPVGGRVTAVGLVSESSDPFRCRLFAKSPEDVAAACFRMRDKLRKKLDSDDFIQTLDDKRKLLRARATKLRADALNGQGSNLADLDPRTFS